MSSKEVYKKWGQIVAKTWIDPKFKKELLAHPAKVLKEHGVELPGVQIKVIANTDHEMFLVLPVKPKGLSEKELRDASGGSFCDALGCWGDA